MSLKQPVIDIFTRFSIKFEGALPFMYLDVRGLVTTGIGNLIDPISMAVGLPWQHKDGALATHGEVVAEFSNIKAHQNCSQMGGGWFAKIATLHLDDDGIDQLVSSKRDQNAAILTSRFPEFPTWACDAQLATMSMAWACGAGFHFPKLEAALKAQDWLTAAKESHMDDHNNPGLRPRNAANAALFTNAAYTTDPDELMWPDVLTTPSEPVDTTT